MFVSHYLPKFLQLYVSQTKNGLNFCFWLLLFLLRCCFCSKFNNPMSRSTSRFKELSFRLLVVVCFFRKKGKLVEMTACCQSMSFVATHCTTRCHSLSFIVICCYQSLLLVVTRCITRLSFYKWSDICRHKVTSIYFCLEGQHWKSIRKQNEKSTVFPIIITHP